MRRRIVRRLLAGWAVLMGLSSGCQAAAVPPGPDAIVAQVARDGATATVNALNRSGRWETVMARIGEGTPAWVALAPTLAAGADAGPAEELGISLASALPRRPEAVLAVLDAQDGPVIGVGRVCGLPFIEKTTVWLAAYRRRAVRAVQRVADPLLGPARGACLMRLARAP